MLPPLPPPMPSWPGNPPWQQNAGGEATDSGGTDQRQLLAYLLGHYHAVQSQLSAQQRAAAMQLPRIPSPQQAAQAQQAPNLSMGAPQGQQVPQGLAGAQGAQPPIMMEMAGPQTSSGHAIPAVPPVAGVSMPTGARNRSYWFRN
jgi:hypothetical protein